MNWIDWILMKFFDFIWGEKGEPNPRYFVIENAVGDPYMCRYRLFRAPGFGIFLHHILRSDEDLELHDHPWSFVSFVLWRGYIEVLKNKIRRFRAGSVIRHRATDAHRLILDRPRLDACFRYGKETRLGISWQERLDPS